MASKPITYRGDVESPAACTFAVSAGRKVAAFARVVPGANGIWHDIRVLESRALRRADAGVEPWSIFAWFAGIAARAARVIAAELRIRRDTRELMAMSDDMLKDIGVARAEIGGMVRYGRN